MKLYAIFANDNLKGSSHALFEKSLEILQRDHTITTLYLYERDKEIPFFRHNKEYMESHPFYIENKAHFLEADALLLVFPLFWYSVPAILKAWLDMINGWAYHYTSGRHAESKHSIKKIWVIYTAMQSNESLDSIHNPVEEQLKETFAFIGVPEIYVYPITSITQINPQQLEEYKQNLELFFKISK